MADILQGLADTSGSAPLTQAQTVKIARYLQQEIREVEEEGHEIKRDVQHNTVHIQGLEDKFATDHEEIHKLQLCISDINIQIHKIQAEAGRMFQAISQLQIGGQNTNDKITQLEENKKMVDVRLDVFSRDLAQESTTGKKLREVIETKINEDMRIVLNDAANARLQLDSLRKEVALVSEAEREDRDSLRQVHNNMETVLNEVKKGNTVTGIIENRLAATAKQVQVNWTKFGELNEDLAKLNECYEKNKVRFAPIEMSIKDLGEAGKRTQGEIDAAQREIQLFQESVDEVAQTVNDFVGQASELRHQINGVRQTADNNAYRIATVHKELIEVSEGVQEVRSGVKAQASLLLPNIHMDSEEASAASARHGSILHSHGLGKTWTSGFGREASARSTPRTLMTR